MVEGSDPQYLKVKGSIKEKYGEATFPNFIREILHESKFKCRQDIVTLHKSPLQPSDWQEYAQLQSGQALAAIYLQVCLL
jgi:hypothetical protein